MQYNPEKGYIKLVISRLINKNIALCQAFRAVQTRKQDLAA